MPLKATLDLQHSEEEAGHFEPREDQEKPHE